MIELDMQDLDFMINTLAKQLGIETSAWFDPEILIPVKRIRGICRENKCGHYGKNYMCPPHSGTIQEIKDRLTTFRRGWLLRYSMALNVKEDTAGVTQTRVDLHKKILQLEKHLRDRGADRVWGMIGGGCGLCGVCLVTRNELYRYPDEARMSLEGIGVDVGDLLNKLGLDSGFYKDRITWTGCILVG
jgi:predicted metal-binding protein